MTSVLSTNFASTNLRVEQIIHIGSQICTGHVPRHIRDAIDNYWTEIWNAIGVPVPDPDYDLSNLRDLLIYKHKKMGYLIQVQAPRSRQASKERIINDWDRPIVKWFYADTYDECLLEALAWFPNYKAEQKLIAQPDANPVCDAA